MNPNIKVCCINNTPQLNPSFRPFSGYPFQALCKHKGFPLLSGVLLNYVVGTTLLELRCWNYVVRTTLLELRCWNCVGGTALVKNQSKTLATQVALVACNPRQRPSRKALYFCLKYSLTGTPVKRKFSRSLFSRKRW